MRPGLQAYIFLCILLLCFIPIQAIHAQGSKKTIDSLSHLVQTSKSDTDHIRLTFQLGRVLTFSNDIHGGILYLLESLKWAYNKKFFDYTSNAMIILANAYMTLERYDTAFTLLESARKFAVQYKNEDNVANVNGNYSYLYNMLGDTRKALEYGFQAIDGFEKSSNPNTNMLSVYSWIEIGKIFENEKQYDKAFYYYNKSLDKAKTDTNTFYVLPGLLNIGRLYALQNQPVQSKYYYKQVLEKSSFANGDATYIMWALLGLGDVDILNKNYNDAINHSKEALKVANEKSLNVNVDNCLCSIGRAFLLNAQYDSAEKYLKNALGAATKSEGWNTINDSYKLLSELAEKQNNYKEALYFNRLHENMSDSIYNKSKVTAINNLEMLYQNNKNEKEIIRLQANNIKKELQLVKRNELLWFIVVISATLFIVFFIHLRNTNNKRMINRQAQLIQQQKINFLEQDQKVIVLKSMLAGQDRERTRIAKDLHDGLSGLFSTIKMHLSTLQYENENLRHNELFKKSFGLIDMAAEDLRRIAHNMMPEVLQKLGLVQALKDFCNSVNAKDSLEITMQTYGMEERLDTQTEIMLYRIVQELINNIIKHANATEAIVQFNRTEEQIDITVEDNGCGFDAEKEQDSRHAGLGIIKERVNYLNGIMSIDSRADIGTTIMITFHPGNTQQHG